MKAYEAYEECEAFASDGCDAIVVELKLAFNSFDFYIHRPILFTDSSSLRDILIRLSLQIRDVFKV